MSVHPEHTRSEQTPHPAVAFDDLDDPNAWCDISSTTESLRCCASEIIVLRVEGEVDLCTLSILQAGLDDGLQAHSAHLIIDLAGMTFCSARGLDLLTHTRRTAAEQATNYVVSNVPTQIDRIWGLVWDGDLPVRYPSTAAAITAIRAHHAYSRS